MNPNQWKQIRELFSASRKMTKEEQSSYIESKTSDPLVLKEVRTLLDNDHEDTFLDKPALGDNFSLSDTQTPEKGMTVQEHLVDGYTISKILGSGASGIVYEATQHEPKRKVAIKVLRASAMGTDEQTRFRREAETLAKLDHPNTATVFATNTTKDGSPWMAMEYINGARLDQWATNAGEREIACAMKKIGDAVQLAHSNHIIHRDLKPANILMTKEGEPKVLDFGVARVTRGKDSTLLTQTGAVIGTQKYMSPEQASGSSNIDERSDVYALGVMLKELLDAKSPADLRIIAKKASDEFPQRRYNNAGEFRDDLQRWLLSKPIKAKRASLYYSASLWVKRHKIITSLLCVIVIAVCFSINQLQTRNWMQYASLIQQAQVAYEGGNLSQMSTSLEECDETFRNWEWKWLQQLATKGELPVKTLSVGSDEQGKLIAVLPNGDVLDLSSGQIVYKISPEPHLALMSKDCSTVIAQQKNGDLYVHSIKNPEHPSTKPRKIDADTSIPNISAMAISDNGNHFVIALTPTLDPMDLSTIDAKTRILGFNLVEDNVYLDDQLHNRILDTNSAIDVAEDGTTIASSIFGNVIVWRFNEITDRRDFKVSSTPSTIAIHPNGKMIAVASLGSSTSNIKILKIQTMLPIKDSPIIVHDRGIISVDLSHDGTLLASIDSNGIMKITPLDGRPPIVELIMGKEQMATVSFSTDADKVFIRQSDGSTSSRSTNSRIYERKIWSGIKSATINNTSLYVDIGTGYYKYTFESGDITEVDVMPDTTNSSNTTPDGKRIATIVKGGSIQIFDNKNNTPLLTIDWPQTQIAATGFINDGHTLCAVSIDGKIRTWNIQQKTNQ
ncbi:MAG: protein kinase [Phycisphaerales bacterium]|nr:protein kinase [Planctomycetota bacterium]MBL6997094.1 protein kinase [Phycisphaerales bacterium]